MSASFFLAARRLLSTSLLLALLAALAASPGMVAGVEGIDPPPTGEPAPVAPPPAIPVELQSELWAALQRARGYSGAPGMSVSVTAADGRQWSGSDGFHGNGAPLLVEDTLLIGSVTKTFTAAIIEALAEEQRLALDGQTTDYLPSVSFARGTTVRQLLEHTSGIADLYEPGESSLAGAPQLSLNANGVLRPIGDGYFRPGTGFAYSNTNYYLLGMIIEVVTGRSVAEELHARFLAPLGLVRTRMASGNDSQLPAAWNSLFWTSGAMVSTPTELARWGQALYTGQAISPARLWHMLDFAGDDHYGEGAQLLPLGDRWVPGHSGLMYDTTTLLIHLPNEAITIAIAATAPRADLEAALIESYDGGPSLVSLVVGLAG